MARQDAALEAAEDELVECLLMLWSMPDRERAWLRGGSAWPTIVREWWEARPDPDQGAPRGALSRREMARVERMFLAPGCALERVPERNRRLVGVVAALKAGRMPGGFRWDDVWQRLGGRLPNAAGESVRVTSATMRARYEAALGVVAAALAICADGRAA